MKKEEIKGMWILSERIDNDESSGSVSLLDQHGNVRAAYVTPQPEMEVLYFANSGEKCFHIGIRERSEEERLEYDSEVRFENTAFFPGHYDLATRTIELIETGKFEIFPDGSLSIIEMDEDYYCEEHWRRISSEETDLALYIHSIINNI